VALIIIIMIIMNDDDHDYYMILGRPGHFQYALNLPSSLPSNPYALNFDFESK
jgi:hypothetical protein